jgi:hypothetical protein
MLKNNYVLSWVFLIMAAFINSYTTYCLFNFHNSPYNFYFAKGVLASPAILICGLSVYIAVKDKRIPLKSRLYYRISAFVSFLWMMIYFPR